MDNSDDNGEENGDLNGQGITGEAQAEADLARESLEYHEREPAGKVFTGLSKPCDTQHDLSIAYSPGVAEPCREIHKNPDDSFRYTGRGNLVGVITNGTAVLGLGNIGPAAAKPVMEGKAMLFKKYADIDVFDIELDCPDADSFIAAVKAMEPTFGGINLEDIKAPECFYIEERLRKEMNIPVFHDDQHGTAIIAAAAFINALEVAEKSIAEVRVVFSGAGAAAVACAALFISLGVKKDNLFMCDSRGVIHDGRDDLNDFKKRFANRTKLRTLTDALTDADAFVGVSVANILKPVMIKDMAKNPIIFALANPDPEIHPRLAREVRPDAIIATGRSDFPNQVNNVLGFPFIFRGALDVRAKTVTEEMKHAAVRAIAQLAKEDVPDVVMQAYDSEDAYQFGREYLIPKPVDPRVLFHVAPAVAQAAMDSGVARKHVDIGEYVEHIERVLGPTQKLMRGLRKEIHRHKRQTKKTPTIVIPHAYNRNILRAAATVVGNGDVKITLLGSKKRVQSHVAQLGLDNFVNGPMVEIINPLNHKDREKYADELFNLRQRKGVSRTMCMQMIMNHNYFAAMMVKLGQADGVVSGLVEPYIGAAKPLLEIIGIKSDHTLAGIYMIMVKKRQFFFADCTINVEPDAKMLADIALTTAEVAKRYTTDPIRVGMLSFASFGATKHTEAAKVAKAVKIVHEKSPSLEIDGEMQADVALNAELREQEFPFCGLKGDPNVFIFPNLAAANISYKLLTNLSDAQPTGPILVGVNMPANVLQRSAKTQEIIDMIYVTAHQVVAGVDSGV